MAKLPHELNWMLTDTEKDIRQKELNHNLSNRIVGYLYTDDADDFLNAGDRDDEDWLDLGDAA